MITIKISVMFIVEFIENKILIKGWNAFYPLGNSCSGTWSTSIYWNKHFSYTFILFVATSTSIIIFIELNKFLVPINIVNLFSLHEKNLTCKKFLQVVLVFVKLKFI